MPPCPNLRLLVPVLVLVSRALCNLEDVEAVDGTEIGVSDRKVNNIDGQIIGGKEAKTGQFPWQVLLMIDLEHTCGASLISDRWVLTAAHCVTRKGNYSVRLGTLNQDNFEESRVHMDIPAQNIIIHQEYNDEAILNDIALIKLPLAVVLPKKPTDSSNINAIRLPKRSEVKQSQEGKMAITSGWGRIDPINEGLYSPVLKWISLAVISNADCEAGFDGSIPSSNICLDTKMENGVCFGDSGGPMVILGKDKKYTLYGVTSFVKDSTCVSGPGAFVRVTSYLDWIKKNSGLRV